MFIPVIGFEDRYEINEYGDILSKTTGSMLKPYITNKGYKAIDLSKNGSKYKFLIHRLVAIHFIPNPCNYPIVLHLDNVKTNTHFSNLVWGTYSQNNAQALKDGLNTIPRPDNREYYEIKNENGIRCVGYGIDEVMNIVHYQYSNRGLYSMIFRKGRLKSGPYKGCTIQRSYMQPAVTFDK